MEQQGIFLAALGVSGKLQLHASPVEGEVRVSPNDDARQAGPGKRRCLSGHDPLIGGRECRHGARLRNAKCEAIIQAARPLQDRPAAAASAVDGNAVGTAGGAVDLPIHLLSAAKDNKWGGGFPKPDRFGPSCGHVLQECVVPAEELRARGA